MGEDHECQQPRDSSWSTPAGVLGVRQEPHHRQSDWSSQGVGPIAKVTVSHLG